MKTIKVRAWHTRLKRMFSAEEMAQDQLALLPTGNFINVNSVSTRLSVIFPLELMTPVEYTGVKDKNGVEIYDGDILVSKNKAIKYVVKFGEVELGSEYHEITFIGWYIENEKYGKSELNNFDINSEHRKMEIIGNIYENPELLEVTK